MSLAQRSSTIFLIPGCYSCNEFPPVENQNLYQSEQRGRQHLKSSNQKADIRLSGKIGRRQVRAVKVKQMCSLWGSRNVMLSDGYHCPRAQFAYRFGHALHGDRNISKEAGALTQLTTLASIICLPPNPFSLALMGNAQHLNHGDPLPPFSISSLGVQGTEAADKPRLKSSPVSASYYLFDLRNLLPLIAPQLTHLLYEVKNSFYLIEAWED